MDSRVRLVFSGEVLDGFSVEDVKYELGQRLNLSEAKQEALFSGARTTLKSSLEPAKAAVYVTKLARLGARTYIEPMEVVNADPLTEARPARTSSISALSSKRSTQLKWGAAGLIGIVLVTLALKALNGAPPAAVNTTQPALTVTLIGLEKVELPYKITANGNVAAWQEASVGGEAHNLRLVEVRVNVGDTVKRGGVLAVLASDTIKADLAQAQAGVAEAQAMLAEAAANAQRARDLKTSGALSEQQISQYLTTERTAQARMQAQVALAKAQELRLQQTQIKAPDDGVISARNATTGAVLPAGHELFRMIRQGRLEWRAEVPSAEMAALKPGMQVNLSLASGSTVKGTVRQIAPTVDAQTRNGLIYVDLPQPGPAKPGMFARGEFEVGKGQGLTLPQSAVVQRDGFSYVLRVGPDAKVVETKVTVGRRVGDQIEIASGLEPTARVVASGGGFLADGDVVRVVNPPATPTATADASKIKQKTTP